MELHQNYKMLQWKQTACAGEKAFKLVNVIKKKGRYNRFTQQKHCWLSSGWLHGRNPGNSLAPDYTSEEEEEAECK